MTLATSYLGLALDNPIVASASPANGHLDHLRRLEDAGAGAIVLPSLFQEEIEAEESVIAARIDRYTESSPEALSYFPAAAERAGRFGPDRYLDLVRRSRSAIGIPVIASLNGSSNTGWTRYAGLIEQAGAAAIELNMFYVATDLRETGAAIEARSNEIIRTVCATVTIPVAVKFTSHLTAIGQAAAAFVEHGASGLVLFNRSLLPDIDLRQMKRTATAASAEAGELRLSLLWTAILAGRTGASLAVSTGVWSVDDVVKSLLAGADVVMTTSALLSLGVGHITTLAGGLRDWMREREFGDLAQMRGLMSWQRSQDRSAFTRTSYMRMLEHGASA